MQRTLLSRGNFFLYILQRVRWTDTAQVEYDGYQQTHDEPGIDETTIAASNNFYVAKEEHVRYVDDLLPDFIYTFNISAKFLDGTFGPPTKLRIETSPGSYLLLPIPICSESHSTYCLEYTS